MSASDAIALFPLTRQSKVEHPIHMGARSPLAPAGTGRRLYSFCLLYVRDLVDVIVTRKHGLRPRKLQVRLLPFADRRRQEGVIHFPGIAARARPLVR